jgi:hypothetical protein
MKRALAVASTLLIAACSRETERKAPPPAPPATRPSPYGAEFHQDWGDGKSEVATYSVDGGRGRAIAITTFEAPSSLRMNLIERDAGTMDGRSAMLSVLISLVDLNDLPAGVATRVSLSRQSWPGHSWRDLLFTRDKSVIVTRDSGAGDSRKVVSHPSVRLAEDAMPLVARRLGWPRLKLGQVYQARVLPSLKREGEIDMDHVSLSLPVDRETVDTPAGTFRCHRFTARWRDGRTKIWFVQGDPPFRIVRWQFSDGERAELLEADRTK